MNATKSLYEVAKEINSKTGISLQAVNKRVKTELKKGENKTLCDGTKQTEKDGKISIRLNDTAIKAVYELYNLVDQPSKPTVDQPVDQPQNSQMELLAATIEVLKQQLDRKDEQIATLSKLVENSQVLLKTEQEKNTPALLDAGRSGSEPQPPQKRNFLSRLFHSSR